MTNTDCAAPLVEVWRGPIVESLHRGHLVAVDGAGQAVAELGAPQTVTFIRSSAKPFQAIPLITSGAADRFGFTDQEIAIACGSHSGEPIHVETVQSMLRRSVWGRRAQCGCMSRQCRSRARNGQEAAPPGVLQNNCSGKPPECCRCEHLGAPSKL